MTKNTFLIIRIEQSLKDKLVKLAGGKRKLSTLIRTILEKNA